MEFNSSNYKAGSFFDMESYSQSESHASGFHDCFDQHELLGSGAQGKVYRCTSKENGRTFAVKIISTNVFVPRKMAMLENELQLLNQINGEAHILSTNIVQVFHIYEIPNYTYILMEQMLGGTLTEWRSKKESSSVTELETRRICRSIFDALEFCHQRGIAHRDIKPCNLLLAQPNNLTSLKIADFGYAKVVPQDGLKTRCGTPLFLPPEIVLLRSALCTSYDTKCDIWSAGVVVYILLGGMPPFLGENKHDLYQKIAFGTIELDDSHWQMVSNEAKILMKGLMTKDPRHRWSVKDALECNWMNTADTSLPTSSLLFRSETFDEASCCCLPSSERISSPNEAIPASNFDSDTSDVPVVQAEVLDQLNDTFCIHLNSESVVQVRPQVHAPTGRRKGLRKTARAVTIADRMTQVWQLTLSAKGLKNVSGFLQTSDPFAIVKIRGDNPDNTAVISQTNVVFNNLSPTWATVVFIEGYQPGVPFYFEVEVFHFDVNETGKSERELQLHDSKKNCALVTESLNRKLLRNKPFPHKTMGTATFEVGEILASRDHGCKKQLQTVGEVYAQLEPCYDDIQRREFVFQLRAFDIKKQPSIFKRTFSLFFENFRKKDRLTGATWIKVYQSNVVKDSDVPIWNNVKLDMRALCNGDLNRAIKIIIWDHHRFSGKHDYMGEFETTVEGLKDAKKLDDRLDTVIFDVMDHGEVSGSCEVLSASIQHESSSPRRKLELLKEDDGTREMSVPEMPEFPVTSSTSTMYYSTLGELTRTIG